MNINENSKMREKVINLTSISEGNQRPTGCPRKHDTF